MSLRVVLDTNLVISALFWGGTPGKVLRELVGRGVPILISQAMLAELQATLEKPRFASRLEAHGRTSADILEEYVRLTQRVDSEPVSTSSLRDPKDLIILEAALGGKASHIVSGDRDILTLVSYQDIDILSASQLLSFLERYAP